MNVRTHRGGSVESGLTWSRLMAVLPLFMLLCLPTTVRAAVDFTITSSTFTYVGDTGVQAIDAAATVQGDNFTNATLRVAITSGAVVTEDILQVLTRSPTLIANNGTISVNLGTSVPIGTYAGGTAGTDLVITLNAAVTPDHVRELLRSIAYFNLAGATPTDANRSVTFTMTKTSVTTVVQTRVIDVGIGNALPGVTTNTGLTVGRSSFVDLRTRLITTDANHGAGQLAYTLTVLPTRGQLVRKNTTPGVGPTVIGSNSVFTQLEIDVGLIAYEHLGDDQTTDDFTFVVSDPLGGKTPATDVDIVISGSVADPVIVLPGTPVTYSEDAPAVAAVLSANVTNADAPHLRQATLEVAFLTVGDVADQRIGDQLSVSNTSGPLVDGSITVVGSAISYRLSGVNHALATIDSQFNGADGVALHITIRDTVIVGPSGAMPPYQISEVITPAVVARLIERITFASTDQDPDADPRLLRFTLRERSPNTGVGVAAVSLAILPVNDAPTFTIPATPTLNLTAVSGIALNGAVLASDPDSPTLTYALVSKSVLDADATVVLNAATGSFVFTPILPFTGPANLVISVTDSVSPPVQVTTVITTQAAPSPVNRPFITSDPPLEIEENGSLFYNLVIAPDPALGTLASATIAFVGQLPAGLTATQLGSNASIWTLTSSPLMRTSTGTYNFGVLVTTTASGGSATCYQPITLRVRATGASN